MPSVKIDLGFTEITICSCSKRRVEPIAPILPVPAYQEYYQTPIGPANFFGPSNLNGPRQPAVQRLVTTWHTHGRREVRVSRRTFDRICSFEQFVVLQTNHQFEYQIRRRDQENLFCIRAYWNTHDNSISLNFFRSRQQLINDSVENSYLFI